MVYRVCSISGEGVRGIIPATIIKEMLKISKSQGKDGDIRDLCDYIVGTSIGGIIGAGLVVSEDNKSPKFTPYQILKLLQDNAEIIFPLDANYWLHSAITGVVTMLGAVAGVAVGAAFLPATPFIGAVGAIGIVGAAVGFALGNKYSNALDGMFTPKYSREGIDGLLNKYFGDLKLTDVIIPFTTVSYSLEQSNLKVWSTIKANKTVPDDFYIKDALGATTATPTFFPHKVTKVTTITDMEKIYYDIDSGIFANTPINLAIAVLLKHAPYETRSRIEKEGITVLSIGAGYYKDSNSFVPPTSFEESKLGYGLLDPLVFKAMYVAESESVIQTRYVNKAIRVDPKLSKNLMQMDKSDSEHIKRLSEISSNFVVWNKEIIKRYVECMILDEDCIGLYITENTQDFSYEFIG